MDAGFHHPTGHEKLIIADTFTHLYRFQQILPAFFQVIPFIIENTQIQIRQSADKRRSVVLLHYGLEAIVRSAQLTPNCHDHALEKQCR